MDEFGYLFIGEKGIVCDETVEMYRFVINFMRKKCPNLYLEDVLIISTDQILDQGLITGFGFVNTLFVIYHWHLKETGLVNHFGQVGAKNLCAHLDRMTNAPSEPLFGDII